LFIGNKSYQAPALIGLSLHQAIEQTSPLNITIQLICEKECLGTIPGTIISQKPSQGRLIKSHQSILVVTTKLPATVMAPRFIGQTEEKIEHLKKSHQIKIKTYSLSYPAPMGSCIGQIPQENQPIADHKMVLYIAKEKPNQYIMPKLINQNISDVVNFLNKHNLNIVIFHQNQRVIPPYQDQESMAVISQKPLPGTMISLKDKATIHVEIEKH